MKDILKKLNIVRDKIVSEKANNTLRFFGLIARADMEGKWDILISADWLEKNNFKGDLIYVIEKLKEVFNEDLDFLAQIVLLTPDENFIKHLAVAIKNEDGKNEKEFNNLKVTENSTINNIHVLAMNFEGISLESTDESASIPESLNEDTNF